ncbi:LemA family protein [Mycobacterium sp.]|uniref:LemA family protein n=1 Tax=Mycobacterium sp. TaxID=1785 RepID=UPI003A845789
MLIWLIIAVLVVALVLFAIVAFNRLRTADVGVQEALGGIDVHLTRRADLIPNLVSTVRGYAAHERGVFDEVTQARTGVTEAAATGSVGRKAAAQARLEMALVDVLAVAEAYPDLKASANFQQLQNDLTDTENKLAFARQYYNDATRALNEMVRTIPWMFFTGIAQVTQRPFYQAPADQGSPPTVQF